MTQVGTGFDAHRFGGPGPIVLGGVVVDESRGLRSTSDGDVATHAVIDAILGASALGDLGTHFLPDDPQWSGARSTELLSIACAEVRKAGFEIVHVDVTVIAQTVRVDPYRHDMASALAAAELSAGEGGSHV